MNAVGSRTRHPLHPAAQKRLAKTHLTRVAAPAGYEMLNRVE